ncbi:MAG: hypothetical protein ACE5D0_00790 [Fidelibacterota bacterium]
MIISRIIPDNSAAYKSISNLSKKLDGFIHLKPYHWFAIWVLMASGTSSQQGLVNRYSFWSMSHAAEGLITLLIVTMVAAILLKNDHISFNNLSMNPFTLINHLVLPFFIFLTGWGWINGNYFLAAKSFSPYLLAYISILLMYQINIDKIPEAGYRLGKGTVAFSLLLALASSLLGIIFGDPVISTASIVYAPFLAVAIVFPAHKRHIQRLRIYPIFIYAMFVSVRVPWLLIPLAILFFGLRTYNYFRYHIVFPTFSVDND